MNREDILALIRRNEPELGRRGVARAALFGSAARGEARADSDLDVLVEIASDARLEVYDYVGLKQFIEALFLVRVDVANRATLHPDVRPAVERDALYAF